MNKIFKAHLRKQWSGFLTTSLFIIFAALMLTVGVSINTRSKTVLNEKIAMDNTAEHLSIISCSDKNLAQVIENKFVENDNFKDLTLTYGISLNYSIKNRENFNDEIYALKYDPNKSINKRIPFDVDHNIEKGVYINTCLRDIKNLKVGDTLILSSPNGNFERQIKGYYEELLILWSEMIMLEGYDFDPLLEYALNQKEPEEPVIPNVPLVSEVKNEENDFNISYYQFFEYNVKDQNQLMKFIYDLGDEYILPAIGLNMDVSLSSWSLDTTRTQLMSFANILSAMLIVFSFIMTAVSLLIIRFIIISNMEDDVKNIGILKSLGYTTKNLRTLIFSEYLSVGIVSAIVGVLLSTFILPVFTNIIGMTVYLVWHAKITLLGSIIGILVPPLLISAVVWLITAKYKKITPVVALRRGLQSVQYRKNYLPLKKYDKMPNLVMSLKSILNGGKKWISIGIVMVIVSFFSVFTYMLHYNVNVDNTVFVGLTGTQPADVSAYTNMPSLVKEIESMDEIDFVNYGGYGISIAKIEKGDSIINLNLKFYKDYKNTKLSVVYEGRYPEKANEIALTNFVVNQVGLKIGETVSICEIGVSQEFVLVGICQNMSSNNLGYMTGEGMQRFLAEGQTINYNEIMFFTKKNTDLDAFYLKIDNLLKGVNFGKNEYFVWNDKEHTANMYISDSIMNGSEILTYAMDGIAMIAIFIIIMFIIRLKLIREKKNIALNKALGITTWGIMTEVCIGTVMVISLSTVIGAALGALLAEKLLGLALYSFGIMKFSLIIPIWQIALIAVTISGMTYLIAMLLSLATKRISPRHLQTN